ncbi:tyrosine-type recombinase/integrase [Isoptericola sp. NPDC056618]|uniref:tyrosine-type recombinase/integrase n=1 Tax=Isoptericola sp. NPDC056618 TaxID=3345878 RepID=UPI0036C1F3FE
MASIKKRPDGRWRARYRDDAGKEHAKHFDRKVDAQRWLDEVTAALVTGAYADPRAGRVTFDAWWHQWASRQVWEDTTSRSMDLTRRSVTFGDVPLRSLRPSHLEGWVKAMTSKGLAPTTIASRMNGVRSAFKAAIRDRLIVVDPSVGITLPRQRRREAAMTIPTPEQVGAILEASDPYRRPLVYLSAFAGLRLGEVAAVKATDVDFLRRRLHVARQVQRQKGGGLVQRAPKYGSERDVYLPDSIVQMLAQHLEEFGIPLGGWLVMAGNSSGPLPPTTAHAWWTSITSTAGVQGIRHHDLRHFFASGLIAAGCDVVTVQRALGHSSATVTLNTYSHLWPTAEDRTRVATAHLVESAVPSRPSDEGRVL